MRAKVYQFHEHQIPIERIDSHAFYVIEKLRRKGHKAYLVGGGVRDLLLKQTPKDFDVSTSARPEEIKSLFKNALLIGRRFRLAHIRFGKKVIEVSTFRSGATEEDELIIKDNEWGTEEEDVLRRDFTINGLFYDPKTQTVIDYVNGYEDLEKRVLKTIGNPEKRFRQDPVRMIRLIKFSARFGFTIDVPTLEALLKCKDQIIKSSSARVFEELLRMLESGAAKAFFHLLHEYGLLKALFPSLSPHLKTDNHSLFDLLYVIDDEVKKEKLPIERSLLLACLIFPIFSKGIEEKCKEKNSTPHLGQIAQEAFRAIEEIFHPFFTIPKKIKGSLGFLMTSQYRFIPIDKRKIKKPKPPKDPLFPLALQLLKYRSLASPELLPHYTLWTEAKFQSHINPFPRKRGRRRRKRS